MTDLEFDILDEIYFLTSFDDILSNLGMPEDVLKKELEKLIEKGWVKCLDQSMEDVILYSKNTIINFRLYNYLASKEGLLAHNSK